MTMDEWRAQNEQQLKDAPIIDHVKQEDADVDVILPNQGPMQQTIGGDATGAEKMVNVGTTGVGSKKSTNAVTESKATEGFGTFALVLGILSIIFGLFFGGAPWIGIIIGVGGIVLGAVEKKKGNPHTKKAAKAGFVCGIIGVSLSIVMGIVCTVIGILVKGVVGLLKFLF